MRVTARRHGRKTVNAHKGNAPPADGVGPEVRTPEKPENTVELSDVNLVRQQSTPPTHPPTHHAHRERDREGEGGRERESDAVVCRFSRLGL